jgi:hypothetical protein
MISMFIFLSLFALPTTMSDFFYSSGCWAWWDASSLVWSPHLEGQQSHIGSSGRWWRRAPIENRHGHAGRPCNEPPEPRTWCCWLEYGCGPWGFMYRPPRAAVGGSHRVLDGEAVHSSLCVYMSNFFEWWSNELFTCPTPSSLTSLLLIAHTHSRWLQIKGSWLWLYDRGEHSTIYTRSQTCCWGWSMERGRDGTLPSHSNLFCMLLIFIFQLFSLVWLRVILSISELLSNLMLPSLHFAKWGDRWCVFRDMQSNKSIHTQT